MEEARGQRGVRTVSEVAVEFPAPLVSRIRRWLSAEADLADATWWLLCLFALAIPFSIALAQTLLTLTTAVAVRHWWIAGKPLPRSPLDLPIACFILAALLAAILGLDVRQGLWGTRTYLQVVILYLILAHVPNERRALLVVRFFLVGMIVTSAHTVFNAISPWRLPKVFPGEMTESGQLLFAIGLTASLSLYRALWPSLLPYALALHSMALLANLKRGVWLGTLAMMVVIGLARSWRMLAAATVVFAATATLVPDVRVRIENTVRDLYLPGNRYDIWMAAVDVIERFPMGIGRKNGTILRDYPNVPPNHKHAHNNLLQITVESGFFGLVAFLW
ncbi:MAG: O-antigen ligase family protein, partial [Candidatus Binatia bacterium]